MTSAALATSDRRATTARYFVVVCTLAAVAAATAAAAAGSELMDATAVLIAGGLLITTPAPVLTRIRGDTIALTVDEVLLVPALVLMPPDVAVVATALGVAGGMLLGRRWSAPWVRERYFARRRTAFNVAQKALAAAVAATVVAVVDPGTTAAALVTATVAGGLYGLLSRWLVAGMIGRLSKRPTTAVFLQELTPFVVLTLGLLAWGALATLFAVAFGMPALWLGLTVVTALIVSAISNRIAHQHERLTGLLDAASRIAAAGTDLPEVQTALEESARRLLQCRQATLEARAPQDGELAAQIVPGTWLRVGDPDTSDVVRFDRTDHAALETLASIGAPALEHARAVTDLRLADDLKAAVIASVSHDLRSPLYAAVGIANVLADAPDLPEPTRLDLVDRLRSSVGRVARLVEGLLDLERYELGRLPEPADAEVGAVVRQVIASVSGEAPIAPIVEGDDAIRARIDAPALERVVENLVANAHRHGPDDEPVVVSYHGIGDRVRLTVDDAGPGVPLERRTEIFEPFRHGGSGIGLGLWVARRFVELRDGRIWVETGSRGGAAFHVELPVA